MPQVVIEEPVVNSPYEEPSRHFYLDEDGITNNVVATRRLSSCSIRTPAGEVNLIIEVTGEKRTDKEAKVATARTLWVPAVNNHGAFGDWAFIEITDPWGAKAPILAAANTAAAVEVA